MSMTCISDIGHLIRELVAEWCGEDGNTPEDINNGSCDAFARTVERDFPGARAAWDYQLDRTKDSGFYCCHMLVEYEGRYYDAERPDGVEDWKDLPYFVREREHRKRREQGAVL